MIEGVRKTGPLEWEVPVGFVPGMRVPGRFFLSDALATTLEEGAIQQLANVATMPGHYKKCPCHARYPLGIWFSDRRRCCILS